MSVKYIVLTPLLLVMANLVQAQQPAPLPPAYPTHAPLNYVRTWETTAPLADTAALTAQPLAAVKVATQYLDGMGRPLQTTTPALLGNTFATLVQPHCYDALGRETHGYLPYVTANSGFRHNAFAEQQSFMQQHFGPQGETFFYGRTDWEASPLGRPLKTLPPGNNWVGAPATASGTQGRGTTHGYQVNTMADSVRIWTVTEGPNGGFGTYTATGLYAPAQLQKTILTDEQGQQTVEFKDKNGRVLLRKVQLTAAMDNGSGTGYQGWLCTIYIYDDGGLLRCVLQPKAVGILAAGNWILDAMILDGLTFRYLYDGRGRMTMKKVPGAAPVYMVYDGRDRLVLTQDGNLAVQGKWAYTRYDGLNRPSATGLWTTGQTPAQLWAAADPLAGMTSGVEELTNLFYDGYGWLTQYGNPLPGQYGTALDGYLLPPSNTAQPYAQANMASSTVKGLPTGSRTKVLQAANLPAQYLYTVSFYDADGRVIQTQQTNASGATDITTTQYGWAGQPLVSAVRHQRAAQAGIAPQTSTVITQLAYDDLGRLTKMDKKVAHNMVNNGTMPSPWTTVAEMQYDELGQLKKKGLGPAAGGAAMVNAQSALETLEYDYNIRGWMLGANRDYLQGTGSHWFGFDLGYDKLNTPITGQHYAAPQYNGNIGGTVWRARGDGELRKYDFGYDAANRLTKADFNQLTGGQFNKTAGLDFSVSGLRYDVNGNILSMAQKGWQVNGLPTGQNGSGFIDRLRYEYELTGNKLRSVFDTANDNASKSGDFKFDPATKTATDYGYDTNGNLALDNNKRIANIRYNHLNLPQLITVVGNPINGGSSGLIEYVYDAAGNKLKKIVRETNKPDKVTEYINGFVYQDGQLQLIPHEEGRIRLAKQYYANGDSAWTLQYDYFLKDHLGNVRTVLTAQRDTARYAASFELAQRAKETALFTNIAATAYPIASVASPAYPEDGTTEPNKYTSKLNGANKQLGATLALKVMAGDRVDIGVKAWVPFAASAPDIKGLEPQALLQGLIEALTNGASQLSGKASAAQLQGTGSPMLAGINSFLNGHNDLVYPSPPRAYLNWILFDEQFKYVPSGSGFIRVGYYEDGRLQQLVQNGLSIGKSGFLFVYLSNETSGKNVFFDNLTIQHYTGPLVEETQYYPFGLEMKGISSKAVGRLENRYKFNDGTELQNKELSDGSGLDLYETPFRSYDPQLGRFNQVDPLSYLTSNVSTYAFGLNNPILRNDPTGLTDSSRTMPTVVLVSKIPKLKGGKYNGQSFNSIKEINDYGIGASYTVSKRAYTNEQILDKLKSQVSGLEAIGKALSILGTLGGGSNIATGLQRIKDYTDFIKNLKSGKIQPNAMAILVVASTIVFLEGQKSENAAKKITEIVNAYIEIHSNAKNPTPPPALGMYVISVSSTHAGTGGGGYSGTTYFYDIATKQILGETSSN